MEIVNDNQFMRIDVDNRLFSHKQVSKTYEPTLREKS